jgi:hypothetical protein
MMKGQMTIGVFILVWAVAFIGAGVTSGMILYKINKILKKLK